LYDVYTLKTSTLPNNNDVIILAMVRAIKRLQFVQAYNT